MYRVEIIPRGIWILSVIVMLLIVLLVFSAAISKSKAETIVIGPEVKTGNPADYMKGPLTSAPPTEPIVTPPPVVTPATPGTTPVQPVTPPPPPPAPQPPAGLPQSITFSGKTWHFSGGPVQIGVVTTGQLSNGHIVYHKQNDQPPYKVLYVESSPNSGKFYTYVPRDQWAGETSILSDASSAFLSFSSCARSSSLKT